MGCIWAPGGLGCCPSWGGGSVIDFLFTVTPNLRVCNSSMFCCTLLCVHSGIAVVLVGGELVVLLGLSSWCLVVVGRLFLAVPWGCLRFVIVVFPDHTHLLFLKCSRHLKAKFQKLFQTKVTSYLMTLPRYSHRVTP